MDRQEIRALREALGLSQQELGLRLGLAAITASRWERGISHPNREALKGLEELRRESSKSAREEALVKKVISELKALHRVKDPEPWRWEEAPRRLISMIRQWEYGNKRSMGHDC
ncbi:MAG: helix-turn-helix domain-containing protein [Dehalococcoidia bacterium]